MSVTREEMNAMRSELVAEFNGQLSAVQTQLDTSAEIREEQKRTIEELKTKAEAEALDFDRKLEDERARAEAEKQELQVQMLKMEELLTENKATIEAHEQNLIDMRAKKDEGKKRYNKTLSKGCVPDKFSGGRPEFEKFQDDLTGILEGHNFQYVIEVLEWVSEQKSEITVELYDEKCKEEGWTDDDQDEHNELNRLLMSYLKMYTDVKSKARKIVKAIKAPHNGEEAWRKLCERFNPRTEVQAMAYQEEAMKLTAAKNVNEIWEKLDLLEELDRQCEEH